MLKTENNRTTMNDKESSNHHQGQTKETQAIDQNDKPFNISDGTQQDLYKKQKP